MPVQKDSIDAFIERGLRIADCRSIMQDEVAVHRSEGRKVSNLVLLPLLSGRVPCSFAKDFRYPRFVLPSLGHLALGGN